MINKRKKIDYNLVKEVAHGASLSEIDDSNVPQMIEEINLEYLVANPYQPRINMDDKSLEELADSIKANGLIQPITIEKNNEKQYTILYGHRRVAAHLKLGIDIIKSIVVEKVEHAQLAILPLVENLQREEMNTIEVAISMKRIIDEKILPSQKILAEQLGISKSWMSKILSILKLPIELINIIREEKYNDITVLSALNKIEDNHVDIYNKIKYLDRKSALKYINSISKKNDELIIKRISILKNKILINTKGLSNTKRLEVEQYIKKINDLIEN